MVWAEQAAVKQNAIVKQDPNFMRSLKRLIKTFQSYAGGANAATMFVRKSFRIPLLCGRINCLNEVAL
jgi:hypothetical protein